MLNFGAQKRAEANYGSMFGMPCYLANSDIAEVGYRGDHVDAAATQQMRVIVGQLLLMVKSFPAGLCGGDE